MRFAKLITIAILSGSSAVGLIGDPTVGVAQGKTSAQISSEIGAHSGVLTWMDTELARILSDIDAQESIETQDALRQLRARANTLVFRITQTLADDYPCRPTKLPLASKDTDLPKPTEYVEFDVAPELLSMDSPVYPETALREGVEGTVLVRVLVSSDGVVKNSIVIQSVPGLDAAAETSARTARFKPALIENRPVAIWMVIPIEFSLRG